MQKVSRNLQEVHQPPAQIKMMTVMTVLKMTTMFRRQTGTVSFLPSRQRVPKPYQLRTNLIIGVQSRNLSGMPLHQYPHKARTSLMMPRIVWRIRQQEKAVIKNRKSHQEHLNLICQPYFQGLSKVAQQRFRMMTSKRNQNPTFRRRWKSAEIASTLIVIGWNR